METVQPESVGLSSHRLERIQTVMQGYVDRQEFAGVVTMVARHGQVAHLAKVGWQDLEQRIPMAFDSIFRIYSMTKPITSAAVMMVCEEGKVRLGDALSRYIPAFKNPKVLVARNGCDYTLAPAEREIRVHDLFTHTSGLSYGFDQQSPLDDLYRKEFWGRMEKDPHVSLEEMVQILAELPLAFQPGSAFRYSFSIDVLGLIVQIASGMPFETFLQERVFAPLGMVDTAFWVPPSKRDRLAVVYNPRRGGGLEPADESTNNRYFEPPSSPSGGGGLVSTTGDYLRFGQMLLNGGAVDGTRLLGRKTVEWMLQNHLPAGMPANGNRANGFGLGGSVLLHPGLLQRPGSPGNFGWGGAATTEWWIDPLEDLQCLLMTQYMPSFSLPIADDFAMLAYQALL